MDMISIRYLMDLQEPFSQTFLSFYPLQTSPSSGALSVVVVVGKGTATAIKKGLKQQPIMKHVNVVHIMNVVS